MPTWKKVVVGTAVLATIYISYTTIKYFRNINGIKIGRIEYGSDDDGASVASLAEIEELANKEKAELKDVNVGDGTSEGNSDAFDGNKVEEKKVDDNNTEKKSTNDCVDEVTSEVVEERKPEEIIAADNQIDNSNQRVVDNMEYVAVPPCVDLEESGVVGSFFNNLLNQGRQKIQDLAEFLGIVKTDEYTFTIHSE